MSSVFTNDFDKNSDLFELSKVNKNSKNLSIDKRTELEENKKIFDKIASYKQYVYEELESKGIIDLYLAKKDGYFFREDGLSSKDASNGANQAKEAFEIIQKAALYDFRNPINVKGWLDSLAPYLNNATLNLEFYSNIESIKPINPMADLLSVLKENNYDKIFETVKTEEEAAHNRVANAYNILKNSSFLKLNPIEMEKQLQIVEPYIENKEIINNLKNISDIESVEEKSSAYIRKLRSEGVINTILNILEENEYNNYKTINFEDGISAMTTEQLQHNEVHLMYLEIKQYGMLINQLKKQIDQEEILIEDTMNSSEIQNYLEKMELRTNFATWENEKANSIVDNEEKTKVKILSSIIDKFVNKIVPKQQEVLTISAEEEQIKQQLNQLSAISNIDTFAYQLRDLKPYINNPDKPLNLSDGTNVIEVIFEKAKQLGINVKSSSEISEKDQKNNPVLYNYAKSQLDDLAVYGCFLTSKCNDIIKAKSSIQENKILIEQDQEIKNSLTTEIEKTLETNHDMNEISYKTINSASNPTHDEASAIQEINEAIKNDDEEDFIIDIPNKIEMLEPTEAQFNNPKISLDTYQLNLILDDIVKESNQILDQNNIEIGKRITEIHDEVRTLNVELNQEKTIKSKDNKQDKLIKKQEEIAKLIRETNKTAEKRNSLRIDTVKTFIDNFKRHKTILEQLKADKNLSKEMRKEKITHVNKCINFYQRIRKLVESIEQLSQGKNNSNIEHDLEIIKQQKRELVKIKNAINKIKDNSLYKKIEVKNLNKMYELMVLEYQISKDQTEIFRLKQEMDQIKENSNSESNVKEKLKQLQLEEKALLKTSVAVNPNQVKEEINSMINDVAPIEEVMSKFDELILPIQKSNESKTIILKTEIEELENKLADNSNYIDENKIKFAKDRLNSINRLITNKDNQIKQIIEMKESNQEVHILEDYRNNLLKQRLNYQEEKQILLQWEIQELESNEETKKALDQLFEESENNLISIETEIVECNQEIENFNKKARNSNEELDKELNKLELDKAKLSEKYERLAKKMQNDKELNYIDKKLKISDLEELNKKKKQLESLDLSNVKNKFLETYEKELNTSITGSIQSPDVLENGDEIKSDNTIINSKLINEQVISIKKANRDLIRKAKNVFNNIGDSLLAWIKANNTLTSKVGAALVVTTMATTIMIKALSGDNLDNINTSANLPIDNEHKVEIEAEEAIIASSDDNIVSQVIHEYEQENDDDNMLEESFKEAYDSVIEEVVNNEANLYTNAYDAILDQNSVSGIYEESFENANLNKIYKLENGKLNEISYDEAQSIVENGGQVSVAVENDGIGIGYIAIDGEELNDLSSDNKGISK